MGKVTTRAPMTIRMRAKQFAMFDALKGLTEAIAGKEQQCCPQKELAEDIIDELNQKLMRLSKGDKITVEYYCEYGKAYKLISGEVKKLDTYWKSIQVGDVSISFSEIMNIYNY